MKIRFDPDFDGGAWPGPLVGRDAAAGEAWLGQLGFLDRLELSPAARAEARTFLAGRRRLRESTFGNAREVRLLLEAIQERQADRLVGEGLADPMALSVILPEDVPDPERAPDAEPRGFSL